ncbi:MAG TPA: hypothetical protein P5234_03765 [Thermoanaerobaculaceae bacterium]|nr:hypothetical protein [Thermoanaerobaculaceae bacterium]HRS15347.1 hypothetical protein [Thermoanaerobaculaceae bacterium]
MLLAYFVASVLPIRMAHIAVLSCQHARRGGVLWDLVRTSPLVFAGHTASLAGESSVYLRQVLRPSPTGERLPRTQQ